MRLAWGAKVSPLFRERVLAICARLGIEDPSWLMACMAFETGRRFTSDVVNQASGATGLIQFMPSTARGLGTTTTQLAALSPEDQLEWVERYFLPSAGRLRSLDDVYMAILWPAAVGKLLTHPLFSKDDTGSRAYFQNRGLDINADGIVTKGEATAYVQKALNEGLQMENWIEIDGGGAGEVKEPMASLPPRLPDESSLATPPTAQPEKPMLPALLATLLPQILNGFSPAGQAQAKPILGQPIEQLAPLLLNLFSMVAGKTGVVPEGQPVTTDAQAIATVAEFNKLKTTNATLVAEIEQSALDRMKIVGPMVDKLIETDAAENAARIAGRQGASSVAIEEHKAGLWDMTRTLVTSLLIMLWGVAWGLLYAIIKLATSMEKTDPTMITALIGLAGPIWTGALVATVVAIVAYRFDGSTASNASRAINAELNMARVKA